MVRRLDEIGLGLKDGHPYNIAYNKGKFYFIDFGSIILNKTYLWTFQEFINTFINWIICKTKGIGQDKLLIEENISEHLTNEEQEQYNLFKKTILALASYGEIIKAIELLYHWINFYESKLQIVPYNSNIPKSFLHSIVKFIKAAQITKVILISGHFANIGSLNQNNNLVTVFNEEPKYIDFIYSQIKPKATNISPAFIDFLNPNGPNDGSRWFNAEIRFSSEMIIVFNYFLTQTDFGALCKKLKLFTVKYAVIEIFYPPNKIFMEAIKQDFNVIDISRKSYAGKRLLFLKVK